MQSQNVPALIFGPALPPGGILGSVTVTANQIEASFADTAVKATLASLTLRSVGFGKPGVELAWKENDAHWAVHVLNPDDANRLLQHSPLQNTSQAKALMQTSRRNKAGRVIGWSVLGLLVLSPLLLIGVMFLFADSIADWVTQRIPVEHEMRIGQHAFDSMQSQLRLQDQGEQYEAVKSIVARLTANSRYTYQVHVSKDPVLNAFAMPGGIVVVNTGLIAATKRPEELAGVLAHEVQHVELRHSLRGIVKNLGMQSVWAMVTGDLGNTIAGQMALELTTLKFSRDAESEADAKGFDALTAANIDPAGMPDFFATMNKEAADAPVAFISTHPLSSEREQVLREKLQHINRAFPSLNFGTWPPH